MASSSPCVVPTSIHDLPDDVLVEILCKLAFKDMNSCKYTSKLWSFLISKVCLPRISSNHVYSLIFSKENKEKSFAYVRSSNDRSTTIEISFEESGLLDDTASSLPFHPSPDAFRDCCNGLLLYFDQSSKQYYLYNPCTRKYITIPNPPGKFMYKRTALIFDSHYKLLNMDAEPPKLNIFSLVTHQWSAHHLDPEISFPGWSKTWDPHYIYLDGSVYKLCAGHFVLKFDLSNPVDYRKIEIPERQWTPVACLGVSQGVLHYGCSFHMRMMVWTLKIGNSDCPDEWISKYNIYFRSRDKQNYNVDKIYSPNILAFHPTADKTIIGDGVGLYFFDPNKLVFENICVFSSEKKVFPYPYHVHLFSPNITSLKELC